MTREALNAMERRAAELLGQGRYAMAEALYRELLGSGQASATALGNLAALCGLKEEWDEMLILLQNQAQLAPGHPLVHRNTGLALLKLGRWDEAVAAYRHAVQLHGGAWENWFGLADAYREQGDVVAAMQAYQHCLTLQPACVAAANNLGGLYQAQGNHQAALAAYQRAIAADPQLAESHNNLGCLLHEQGKMPEAIEALRQAIRLRPEFALAHVNLGLAHLAAGDEAAAKTSFRRAAEHDPHDLGVAFAGLCLPEIHGSESAIRDARRGFEDELDALQSRVESNPECFSLTDLPWIPTFALSYHHCDDRPLLEKVHRLLATAASATRTQVSAPPLSSSSSGQPWRHEATDHITLVSGLFRSSHVIGKLYAGLVSALATDENLEVCLAYPAVCPETGDALRQLCDNIHALPLSASTLRAQQQLHQLKSDAVFFLDVDMVPAVYRLAHERFAPLQFTSWGTPNTTGMASFDYYLSADCIEPEGADAAYSETLIRLTRLPSIYAPPALLSLDKDRRQLGLPTGVPLIGLPQSLFKLHPDYDLILERILTRLPDAVLVLIAPQKRYQQHCLLQRWELTAPAVRQRSLFLPRQSRERYLALLDAVDVLLDPFYFGCGNSFYEAMAVGTPLVTWPSRFMRGRIVAGGYRQMGLADAPIASSPDDYVDLVHALVLDHDRRMRLKAAICAAAHQHLFEDGLVASDVRQFLQAALAASRVQQRLPSSWRPGPQLI